MQRNDYTLNGVLYIYIYIYDLHIYYIRTTPGYMGDERKGGGSWYRAASLLDRSLKPVVSVPLHTV